MFLFVEDVVLGASNDTSVLNTADGLSDSVTRQVRVWRETFPVALEYISTIQSVLETVKTYTALGVAT
jgi:hypothetical protein